MTNFDPKIFNKKNLKEKDLVELEYIAEQMNSFIAVALSEFQKKHADDSNTLAKIKMELIESFCELLREKVGEGLQEMAVSYIESYKGEVPEQDNYETFFYKARKEDKE